MFFDCIEEQIAIYYKSQCNSNNFQENDRIKYNILSGNNYTLKDLFSFLNELKLNLYIQDRKVESIKEFALALRKERKKNSITRLELLTELGLNFNTINKIESGKNLQKETLKKYLSYFPNLQIQIKNS